MDKLNYYLEKLARAPKEEVYRIECEICENVVLERDLSLLKKILQIKKGTYDKTTESTTNS